MSNELMKEFNWLGRLKRGAPQKRAFCTLNLREILFSKVSFSSIL